MAECIDLFFGIEATLSLSYTALEGNLGISNSNVISLWNFVSKLMT